MRSRSGGIHCESQQQFIHLSQVSQNCTGLFYDEKVNKKAMKHLNTLFSPQNLNKSAQISNPQLNSQKKTNLFIGFDFHMQNQYERQQKQQLQRMKQSCLCPLNIALINNKAQRRQSFLKIDNDIQQNSTTNYRYFDLQILYTSKHIIKCWLFNIPKTQINRNSLYKMYLNKCRIILELNVDNNIQILNNGEAEDLNQIVSKLNNTINTTIFI